MANTFDCPNCGQKLTAKPEMAGVIIDCPACGSQIQVPAFEAPVPMVPQPPAYPPSAIPQRFQNPYGQQMPQPYGQMAPQPFPQQMQQPQQPYGYPQQPYGYQPPQPYGQQPQEGKDWLTTLLLCFFLGPLGIHAFYAGNTVSGVIQLLTGGVCGIWTLVDFILILCGKYTDGEGRPLVRKH